jgi:uncharacterized Zn finger protein (UPF0148 family)
MNTNPDFNKEDQDEGLDDEYEEYPVCYLRPGERLREGSVCPRCHGAKMTYDGMLNLVCPNCGLTEAGACT